MAQIKRLTPAEVAQAFAAEYSDVLSWRIRSPQRGEPYCWFFHGRLDEYAISALELGRQFLKNACYRDPQRFGGDVRDERVYEVLEQAKKILTVK